MAHFADHCAPMEERVEMERYNPKSLRGHEKDYH
jgi:hypothetical protein